MYPKRVAKGKRKSVQSAPIKGFSTWRDRRKKNFQPASQTPNIKRHHRAGPTASAIKTTRASKMLRAALPARPAAAYRAGSAARNLLLALLLFITLAVGPALWWRFTFGVWLAG